MLTTVGTLPMAEPVSSLAIAGMGAYEAMLLWLYMAWCIMHHHAC